MQTFDHNHLRITRILRSMRVLGLSELSFAFYCALTAVAELSEISENSVLFWTRAIKRPLNIKPDVLKKDENENMGPAFLVEFEKERREAKTHSPSFEHGTSDGDAGNNPLIKEKGPSPPYLPELSPSASSPESMDYFGNVERRLEKGKVKALLEDDEYTSDEDNDHGGVSIA